MMDFVDWISDIRAIELGLDSCNLISFIEFRTFVCWHLGGNTSAASRKTKKNQPPFEPRAYFLYLDFCNRMRDLNRFETRVKNDAMIPCVKIEAVIILIIC